MKTILVDAVHTFFIKGEGVYKPLYDLLETYQNQKIILTNANPEQRESLGIVNMPYEVFSLDQNPTKADPEYFVRMLDYLNLSKDDVVYFEHNAEAVESAKSIGIPTYHYDKETRNLKALKDFLDQSLAS
ncbi:MAG: HAD-IA family hydrolase [Patescibacteria group bacterium UBA2103]